MKPCCAYHQMLDASARLKLPRSFKTDLTTHDRDSLDRRIRMGSFVPPFVWCLYAHGTHIVWADEAKNPRHVHGILKTICEDFSAEAHWFKWDGDQLTAFDGSTLERVRAVYDSLIPNQEAE